MAQITPVGQEQQKNNTVIAACGAGLGAGAIAGYGIEKMPLVPKEAKFTSVQQLVDAMTGQDKFELKIPESASKEAKEAAEAFDILAYNIQNMPSKEKYIDNMIKKNSILKGRESVTIEEFAKEYFKNIPESKSPLEYAHSNMGKLTGKCQLYEQIARIPDGKKVAVKGIAKKMQGFKDKNAQMLLAETLKAMGVEPQNGLLTITPELKANCERAAKMHNKYCEFLGAASQFKDGKYTKQMASESILPFYEAREKGIKEAIESKEIQSAFSKLQEYLPKVNNKFKGAMIWGAIGTAAAGAIAHFMTKDKKSA